VAGAAGSRTIAAASTAAKVFKMCIPESSLTPEPFLVEGLPLAERWATRYGQVNSSGPFRTRMIVPKKLMRNYSLAEINQGFADSASGETVKPVVVF
jgi:hypothetical protein